VIKEFSKEILSSWKNTIPKFRIIEFNRITFASNLNYTQEMKKFFAFAFVAGMVAFAACTSKPADESADTTAVTVETPAVDTTAVDTTAAADTTAADTTKK
jgi:hypothetical protein